MQCKRFYGLLRPFFEENEIPHGRIIHIRLPVRLIIISTVSEVDQFHADHIKHDHIALLPITVDTSHTLLQAIRIPWDIPIDQQSAELKIDTFTCGIGTYQNLRLVGHEVTLR